METVQNSIDFKVKRQKSLYYDIPVRMVSVCGVPSREKVQESTGAKLLHWRIHFLYYEDDSTTYRNESFIVDTVKEDERSAKVEVEIQYRPYARSVYTEADIPFIILKVDDNESITAHDLVKFIERNGRQVYSYNTAGSGCLTWTRAVVSDMVDAGYVYQGAVKEIDDEVERLRSVRANELWVPTEEGASFYRRG